MNAYSTPPPEPPYTPPPINWGERIDRAEKATRTAVILAAVAVLIGVIALVLAIAVFAERHDGDNGWRDNVCPPAALSN